jgi:hypothetical protein
MQLDKSISIQLIILTSLCGHSNIAYLRGAGVFAGRSNSIFWNFLGLVLGFVGGVFCTDGVVTSVVAVSRV